MTPSPDTPDPSEHPPATLPTGLSDATELFSERGTVVHLTGEPPTVILAHGGQFLTTPLADLDEFIEQTEMRLDTARREHSQQASDRLPQDRLRHQRDCLVITKYAIAAARDRQHHHLLGQSLPYRRVNALRDDALTIIERADELLPAQSETTPTQNGLFHRLRHAF